MPCEEGAVVGCSVVGELGVSVLEAGVVVCADVEVGLELEVALVAGLLEVASAVSEGLVVSPLTLRRKVRKMS